MSQTFQGEELQKRRLMLHNSLKRDGLTCASTGGYSIGHVYNDLCAAAWFNYLLFYVTNVIDVPKNIAGFVVLSGQIADGIMTPIVGICSDKTNTACGKRTPWYIFGTILVLPCFFGIFWDCALCSVHGIDKTTAQAVYYTVLPALFNVGWASVQISNLSLNAQLSMSQRKRDRLVNFRTAFTYIANFVVLLVSFVIFLIITDDPLRSFQVLDLILTVVGIICSILYLALVPEVKLSKQAKEYDHIYKTQQININSSAGSPDITQYQTKQRKPVTWRQWLRKPVLYVYGFLYMFVRLTINVYSSMTPFYLKDVLELGGTNDKKPGVPFEIALVPMINYIFSSIFSLFFNKKLSQKFGNRNVPFMIAVIVMAIGLVPYFFLTHNFYWPVYICSAFIGVGFSVMLNTAVSCINDVIGDDSESGAFVFGIYSFLDKIANGVVLYVITAYGLESGKVIRYETTLIALISSGIAIILMLIGTTRFSDSTRALSYFPAQGNDPKMRAKSKLLEVPVHSNSTARFGTVDVGAGAQVYANKLTEPIDEDEMEHVQQNDSRDY